MNIFDAKQPDNTNPLQNTYFKDDTFVVNANNLIMRPDVRKTLFPHLNEEQDFADFFLQSGRMQAGQSEFHHYEEEPLIPVAQIKSKTGSSGNGNSVTVTINAVNADKINPFKAYDVWEVGGVEGWIEAEDDITLNTSTGEHSVVLKVDSGRNIVAAAVAGEWMTWRGNAKADGTGQPKGMYNKPTKFSGRTQIISTSYETDGSAAANMSDVIVTKSGSKFAYLRGVDQAMVRHKMAIALAIGLGQGTNTVVDADADNKKVLRTEGMDWKIQNDGINEPYDVFDFDELQKINEGLDAQNAPDEYIVPCGNSWYYAANKIFFDKGNTPTFGAFAGNDYTRYGSADPKQRALDLGFNSANVFGRTFHLKKEKFLFYKQITAAPGKPYPKNAYFLPITQYTSKDGDGNIQTYETCSIRFKASDRENRYMKSTIKDWTSDGVDKFFFWHLSEIGWQQAMLHWAVRSYYDATASS